MNLTILKQRALMLMVSMMLSVVAFAQDITGQVKDQNGEEIIGASVQVKGTQMGAATDMDGKFAIKGVKAGQTLVISYVGYQNAEVKVGSQSNYNIVLKEDNLALEELVVVGYG
ncbi:MAG: carboxypeptidase-like regulatory domain-containing protein, partial [Prevotella sp.]|nr:carboxypeptidase-like regulatory domain-containing protein [Prevotella sp.]